MGGAAGRRPAFVVTSERGRGAGKSTLAELIGRLFGGQIDVSAGEKIDELKSRLLSPVAMTKRIAFLDNIKTLKLSWAELEALITTPTISGKRLYIGEGQRPNLLTWFITLNGVSLATDMAQRSVIIKLDKPDYSGDWFDETADYIDEHRDLIIGDLIGALRTDPYPLDKFSRWATWEREVLSRLPEPAEAQRLILERQEEANCELDEAEIIEEHFATELEYLSYDPATDQVGIPVKVAGKWFAEATSDKLKTAGASRRLRQLIDEGQLKRLSEDPSRTYGRSFIWTGADADVANDYIKRDLPDRQARHGRE